MFGVFQTNICLISLTRCGSLTVVSLDLSVENGIPERRRKINIKIKDTTWPKHTVLGKFEFKWALGKLGPDIYLCFCEEKLLLTPHSKLGVGTSMFKLLRYI